MANGNAHRTLKIRLPRRSEWVVNHAAGVAKRISRIRTPTVNKSVLRKSLAFRQRNRFSTSAVPSTSNALAIRYPNGIKPLIVTTIAGMKKYHLCLTWIIKVHGVLMIHLNISAINFHLCLHNVSTSKEFDGPFKIVHLI